MTDAAYKTETLTTEERALLLKIFYRRRRTLFSAYAYIIILALLFSTKGIDRRNRYTNRATKWEDNEDAKYVPRNLMVLINFFLLEIPVVSTGVYFWIKRVRPYKRDAACGMKVLHPYFVKDKKYFPLTNQYFLVLDDASYMHHEVDIEVYNRIHAESSIYLPQGIYSKHIFQKDGRYLLL